MMRREQDVCRSNDEFPMTNDERMTNDEARITPRRRTRNSSFVIRALTIGLVGIFASTPEGGDARAYRSGGASQQRLAPSASLGDGVLKSGRPSRRASPSK